MCLFHSQFCNSLQRLRDRRLAHILQLPLGGRVPVLHAQTSATSQSPARPWRQFLNGTFDVNRAVVPTMRAQSYGRIVFIAFVAGKEGNPNASAYSASKAGVTGFAKLLGKELAGLDIAINCVTPAAAWTRIFDQMAQTHIDYILSKIPRGRFLELKEAAEMIAWLCSRKNSFTTAGVLDLSGWQATY